MKRMTIDTFSTSDSDKVIDFLDSENIKYKKTGSKITIMLDRSSLKASVILAHLQKIAKFDEILEQKNRTNMKKTKLRQIIREEIQTTNQIKKEKQKLVNQLIKWGNTKQDSIEMVDKHYDYVTTTYHRLPPAKKASIISSLRGAGY